MPRRKKPPLSLFEKLVKIEQSGIHRKPDVTELRYSELTSLEERVRIIFDINERKDRAATNMIYFIMYDIESTKVRNQVVKYLINKGCHRIQKSIFLASTDISIFNKIKEDLVQIQSFYENSDSILVVPISTDYLQSMKIIGKTIDIDLITHKSNVLFF